MANSDPNAFSDWSAETVTRSEHIGMPGSGETIQAKRVVPYGYDSTTNSWIRQSVNPGLIGPAYDYIAASYPSATVELYAYKTGGSSGTTVGTVTVTYVDSTKALISSVAKS